jgi:hypothetical protein
MAGSEVERTSRAASRPASVPSAGAAASLLPASQAVEGRPGRLAGRTGLRWGLRTLVIGGFAGAAWLLSGAAAHAAEPSTVGPTGPAAEAETLVEVSSWGRSMVPLGNGLGNEAAGRRAADVRTVSTLVTGVLAELPGSAADRPSRLDPARPVDQPSGVSGEADRIPADPAPVVPVPVGARDAVRALPGLDSVARVLAAPFRLPDGSAGSHGPLGPVSNTLAPVAKPLLATLRPVSDLLHHAAAPVTSALPAAVVRLSDAVWAPGLAHPSAVVAARRIPTVPAAGHPGPAADLVGGPVGVERADDRCSAPAQPRFAARSEADAPTIAVGVRQAPDRPEPAPLRLQLGAVGGIAAGASGASSDGGPMAAGSGSVTDNAVAIHRMPVLTGVDLRRFDAEAPTVSPD